MRQLLKKFNSLGLILIIVFYLVLFLQYGHSQRIIIRNAETLTKLSVKKLESNIDKWLYQNAQVICDVGDFIKIKNWNEEDIKLYLESLLANNTSFSTIYYYTKDNQMVNATDWELGPGQDLTNRPWYIKAVKEKKLSFTDSFLNASGDANIVTIAMPLYDSNGQLLGIAAGDVRLQTIVEWIATERLGESGFSFIIDSTGKLVAHPQYTSVQGEEIVYVDKDYTDVVDRILVDKEGFIPIELEGVRGMLAFLPLEKVDWYMVSFIPENEFLQQNSQMTFSFVLSTVASILIFIFFIILLNIYVKKPIITMEKNIGMINIENNASYRLPEFHKAAFISLVKTINGLLDRIESFIKKIRNDEIRLKQLNESLQESEERWQFALYGSGDGVWDWNVQTGETYYSDRWKEICGFDVKDEINDYKVWERMIYTEDLEYVLEENNRHLRGETAMYTTEYRIVTKDGLLKWILARGKVVSWTEDGKPLRMVGTHSDITQRKYAENRIKYLSFHDSLTGLYNRTYFEEQLKLIDAENRYHVGLLMCDANGLKMINDAFGHEEGDRLLVHLADVFRRICRDEDILARIGGDEFGIIMWDVTEKDIFNMVAAIKEQCQQDFDSPIKPSIAVGAAVKSGSNQDIHTVYRQAENRMYKNKLMESKSARSSIIASLRTTLEEKTHETEAHSLRLKELSLKLGKQMGLHDNFLNDLELLAMLHDIGKVAIPDNILDKAGTLNDEEWEIMKKHSEIGYRIAISSSELASIADAILSHHERWDGKGYGQGLKAEEIPLIARIVTIVDAYDAMTNDRPYRKAMSKEEAILELRRCAGSQFDPCIIDSFIKLLEEPEAS